MSARALALALAFAAAAPLVAAQGGGGKGGGTGGQDPGEGQGGRQRAAQPQDCGSDLVVVTPDGIKRRYPSVEEFLKIFETVELDVGERRRPAVPVDVVLKSFAADWMDALDCDNHGKQLPSGLPFEGREYLVWTGRRGLKAVREVRPGAYNNTLQQIRKLTLHKTSTPASPSKQ